jgi:hypothetical protein
MIFFNRINLHLAQAPFTCTLTFLLCSESIKSRLLGMRYSNKLTHNGVKAADDKASSGFRCKKARLVIGLFYIK